MQIKRQKIDIPLGIPMGAIWCLKKRFPTNSWLDSHHQLNSIILILILGHQQHQVQVVTQKFKCNQDTI